MRTEEDFGEFCKILHMTMGVLNRTLENVRTNNAEISIVLVKKTLETDITIRYCAISVREQFFGAALGKRFIRLVSALTVIW